MISIAILVLSVATAHGFLFNSLGGGFGPGGMGSMCTSVHTFCPLKCAAYEVDGHGCEICHCRTDGTQLSQPTEHTIHNPCIPSQTLCPLKCEAFVTGPVGNCEYCQCAQVAHSTAGPTQTAAPLTNAPTTSAPSTAAPTTTTPAPTAAPTTVDPDCAIAKQICSAKCNGKYLVDPSDCTFCICKSEISGI